MESLKGNHTAEKAALRAQVEKEVRAKVREEERAFIAGAVNATGPYSGANLADAKAGKSIYLHDRDFECVLLKSKLKARFDGEDHVLYTAKEAGEQE